MDTYDFIVIGSGFGGSVSAMRLSEKGYRVLVLERGKRYDDRQFPRTNWNLRKFLWLPAARCFGSFQMSLFRGFFVFHGSGVGGGSLVYAAVLMEPDETFFNSPAWSHLGDWRRTLRPHFETARRMLGVAPNPRLTPADHALRAVAGELDRAESFRPTEVGVYFGDEGVERPDPYFGGAGPARTGCIYCGNCMVGCRYNAKNSLPKNYLYFAEKQGARALAETEVRDIVPLPPGQPDGARYEVRCRSSTAWIRKPTRTLRARNVVLSAGVLGTLRLLLRCRDQTKSLPNLSPRLGDLVRTNSEAFFGAFSRKGKDDHSKGLAITAIIRADDKTQVEPVRYAGDSSLIFRLLAAPLINDEGGFLRRLGRTLLASLHRPIEFLDGKVIPGLTRRGVALMVMQTEDNQMRLRLGRDLFTFFRRGLVADHDPVHTILVDTELGRRVVRAFARQIGGHAVGTVTEGLLKVPTTAHMLGGCVFGRNASEGVTDVNAEVFNYPGLFVVDGSIVPANPGVNPSLTITALAEYAMSRIAPRPAGG